MEERKKLGGAGRGQRGFWQDAFDTYSNDENGFPKPLDKNDAGRHHGEEDDDAVQELNAHKYENDDDETDCSRPEKETHQRIRGPRHVEKNGNNDPDAENRKPLKSRFDPKESQQKRREEFLNIQKQRRDEILDKIRQLDTDSAYSDSDVEEEEDFVKLVKVNKLEQVPEENQPTSEEMDITGTQENGRRQPQRLNYKQPKNNNRRAPCRVMMSEWLTEKPEDFEEKWMGIFCPVGKRCLVVANRGKTYVFSRKNEYMGVFQSKLPGGRRVSHQDPEANQKKGVTILDCVWSQKTEVFYVLDLICWNSYSCNNCDKAYRQFFQTSKFTENPELLQREFSNPFPFLPLPAFSCDQMGLVMSSTLPIFKEKVDGLLLFHKDSFYFNGVNPLCLWIYLNDVEEKLAISPSPELVSLQRVKNRSQEPSGKPRPIKAMDI